MEFLQTFQNSYFSSFIIIPFAEFLFGILNLHYSSGIPNQLVTYTTLLSSFKSFQPLDKPCWYTNGWLEPLTFYLKPHDPNWTKRDLLRLSLAHFFVALFCILLQGVAIIGKFAIINSKNQLCSISLHQSCIQKCSNVTQ